MNQKDTNMISCMKTMVFMFFCLLAFSIAINRNSDQKAFKGAELTSEVRHMTWLAVQLPAIHFHNECPPHHAENKNSFTVGDSFDFTSRLIHQRLITLGKNRETIIPLHTIRYYRKLIPANKNDLPDLS